MNVSGGRAGARDGEAGAYDRIRSATAADAAAIGRVVAAAFGRADEAELVERLRADGDVLVELAAEAEGEVVGHVLYSRLALVGPADTLDAAALAPVSVTPARQNSGIGGALVRAGLEACRAAGVPAVVVLGHPTYYPRFGFDAALAAAIEAPFSGPAFMALDLTPGALWERRRAVYARAFGL